MRSEQARDIPTWPARINSGVYYTFYLYFNADKKEIKLQAECNYGERDDEIRYDLPISAEEKESLMFLIIKYFADKEWNR